MVGGFQGVERRDVHLSAAPSLPLSTSTNKSSSSPLNGKTSVNVVKVVIVEGMGLTALTKASSVRRLCSLVIVVVS